MTYPSFPNSHRFFIGGSWVPSVSDDRADVENPATEETVASIAMAGHDDVDAAVAAARSAFADYAASTPAFRSGLLRRLMVELESRADAIAAAVTLEMGSPAGFAKSFHTMGAIASIGNMAQTLDNYTFEEDMPGARIVREPVGVCGLIVPWNAPMSLLAGKVSAPLAAGCTVVVKPSEISPLSALLFAEAVADAGFPSGVFNLINGDGPVAGQRLAAHPGVDMISITGSTRAGRLVAIAAAESVKRVHQELGGKSANILLSDADFSIAVPAGVLRSYVGSGQSCQAPTRMLVPRDRHEEVLELAGAAAASVRVGDPLSSGIDMGPVVNKAQFDQIQSLIAAGIDEGATLVAGGLGRPAGLDKGYFVRPTVFGNVTPAMRIAREEIFGPVLSIIPYDDDAHAIAIANDSVYGLAGWVWSADIERARRVARAMRTGRVYLNGAPTAPNVPFGGYKMSGNGREHGRFGLEEYLEIKAVLGYTG